MLKKNLFVLLVFSFLLPLPCTKAVGAAPLRGNTKIQSFNTAKRLLERQINYDYRVTLYCGAQYTEGKDVIPPAGFTTQKHAKRAKRVEWEHVVPAENFGRNFKEWREGDPACVDKKGAFKGRNCAQKVNLEYRYMQADLYNLYPAIGAVNALRSNYNFRLLPGVPSTFGACDMKIQDRKAEPPEKSRGKIARTYKYMEWAYPRYQMSDQKRKLVDAWDRQYPVTPWECTRAERIEKIQGNVNPFVKNKCRAALAHN